MISKILKLIYFIIHAIAFLLSVFLAVGISSNAYYVNEWPLLFALSLGVVFLGIFFYITGKLTGKW